MEMGKREDGSGLGWGEEGRRGEGGGKWNLGCKGRGGIAKEMGEEVEDVSGERCRGGGS